MIKEYIVKITDEVISDAFGSFEKEYSPEQELVRCKDCRKNMMCEMTIHKPKDWFCADGKRR